MKELSIEEKAKRYDVSIKKAETLYKAPEPMSGCNVIIKTLFPELKVSEDERIRKELLEHCKNQAEPYIQTGNKCPQIQSWIAWLEKQGEQKIDDDDKAILENWEGIVKDNREKWQLSDWFVEATLLLVQKIKQTVLSKPTVDNNKTMLNACINTLRNVGHSHLAAWLEKQGEKPQGKSAFEAAKEEKVDNQNCVNPADKVKPKFNVGDWVVYNRNDHSREVIQIYDIRDNRYYFNDNIHFSWSVKECDEKSHLWTIQDAEDGDVLAVDDETIVIFKDLYNATTFHSYCHIEDGVFTASEKDVPNWWESKGFHPATKEQRDTLEKAMADAGYTFDFEKKELKKIEKKSVEWSEEDENRFINLIYLVEHSDENEATKEGFIKFINKLKFLNKLLLWKESNLLKLLFLKMKLIL